MKWSKNINNLKLPYTQDPGRKYAPVPQPSELEAQIAKKLNWDGYVMQFPQYYAEQRYQTPILNEKGEWVTGNFVTYRKAMKLPPIADLNIDISQKRFAKVIREEIKALQLPPGFKKQFPYLYEVLYDRVVAAKVESLKKDHYVNVALAYREMTQQLLVTIVELFDMIMNRMIAEVPELVGYFERHPEDMELLNFVKNIIRPFIDPQLKNKSKILLI